MADILAQAAPGRPGGLGRGHPGEAPPAREAERLRLDVLKNLDELRALEGAWRDLEQRAGRGEAVFQGYDWCMAWLEACAAADAPDEPRVVALHESCRLVLLWPLAVRRLGPFRIVHTLAEPMTQYSDVLVEPGPEAARRLDLAWREIASWPDVAAIELRRVRADSPLLSPLRDAVSYGADDSFSVALGSPGATRSGRTRNTLRRRVKQLAAQGEVRFERLRPPDAQLDAVSSAFAMKRDWMSERGLASFGLSHPATQGALAILARKGELFVLRLSVGGAAAAYEIGLLAHGRYASFLQAYSPDFAAVGPGRLIFWHLIENGAREGIETFDFLPPSYEHKQEWATEAMPVHDHFVPLTAGGRAVLFHLATVKPGLKRVFGALPPALRRPLARLVSILG